MPDNVKGPATSFRPPIGAIETRGHQPLKANTIEHVAAGYQPTVSQMTSPPAKPPSQGSSGSKDK